MSLAIQVNNVSEVLLADGWHVVEPSIHDDLGWTSSFDVDSYEFFDEQRILVTGGGVRGVPSTGATWIEKSDSGNGTLVKVACPLTAVLAVRQVFKA